MNPVPKGVMTSTRSNQGPGGLNKVPEPPGGDSPVLGSGTPHEGNPRMDLYKTACPLLRDIESFV